jgi:hypothetical protein
MSKEIQALVLISETDLFVLMALFIIRLERRYLTLNALAKLLE